MVSGESDREYKGIMKMLFFTVTMNRGGTERVIANLANRFSEEGEKVNILTCGSGVSSYELSHTVSHLTIDTRLEQLTEMKPKRFLRRRRELKKQIRTLSPDIVVCMLPEPCFLMLSIKKLVHAPIIISERCNPKEEYSNLVYYLIQKVLYRRASGMVFQCEGARKFFDKKTCRNSTIILNPLHSSFLSTSQFVARKKRIVTTGSLYSYKNQLLLIKSFQLIMKEFPEFTLECYGEGPERQNLQEYIYKNQLQDKILLPGIEKDMKARLEEASLFVLPSNYEGLPNALIEAMALGLPVIATDCPCGGPASLIQDEENGLLVEVGNVEAMANAIRKVIKNPSLAKKLGDNASKIVGKVNPDIVFQQWKEYICKICR